ncbi:MAG: PDZ domain-containing protein, partial [Rhodospirillales bacterium]|nr:PDZ domain-containing protein [Rhodospirillales bacterium]
FPAATVGGVIPGMPASQAHAVGHEGALQYKGLQVGDVITHVDGKPVGDFLEGSLEIALSPGNRPVAVTVKRPGVDKSLTYEMIPVRDEQAGLLSVGFPPYSTLQVMAIDTASAAAEAGVEPGMQVTAVDGKPVQDFHEYHDLVVAKQGEPVMVTFTALDSKSTVQVPQHAVPLLTRESKQQPLHILGFVPALEIAAVVPGSAAEAAGVKTGDILVRLGEVDWPATREQVSNAVIASNGKPIHVTLLRDGELVHLHSVAPRKTGLLKMGAPMLGIATYRAFDKPIFGRILPDSPADQLQQETDLPGGSQLVQIGGQAVRDWDDLQRIAQSLAGKQGGGESIDVTVRLQAMEQPTLNGQIQLNEDEAVTLAQAPWTLPSDFRFATKNVTIAGDNPVSATVLGVEKTHQYMTQTYLTLLRLVQGTVPPDQLRGPVGIVEVGAAVTRESTSKFLFLLGLISVNLAVLNFLPIPIVDGGHI